MSICTLQEAHPKQEKLNIKERLKIKTASKGYRVNANKLKPEMEMLSGIIESKAKDIKTNGIILSC